MYVTYTKSKVRHPEPSNWWKRHFKVEMIVTTQSCGGSYSYVRRTHLNNRTMMVRIGKTEGYEHTNNTIRSTRVLFLSVFDKGEQGGWTNTVRTRYVGERNGCVPVWGTQGEVPYSATVIKCGNSVEMTWVNRCRTLYSFTAPVTPLTTL